MDPSIANNEGETALTLFGSARDGNDPDDEDEDEEPLSSIQFSGVCVEGSLAKS